MNRDRASQEVFQTVVDAYQGVLLRYAARILASHASEAEDIVQNAFLKCVVHWKGPMEPSGEPLAWLYRVVRNEAFDHLRRERRRVRLFSPRNREDLPPTFDPPAPEAPAPPDAAVEAVEALASLDDRERELVTLKIYEERTYAEIADIAGLTPGNVGFILHGAMRKLARLIQKRRQRKSEGGTHP